LVKLDGGAKSAKTIKHIGRESCYDGSATSLARGRADMRATTEQAYKERLLRVLIHIQSHLDETIPLEDLAGIAHFSPYHFHRVFRGMVGESVKEHIRRLRLERAAHRLKFSDLPITHIALEAGYETHEAFTRAFGSMFGTAPALFRQTHRALPYPAVPSGIHFSADGRLTDFQVLQTGGRELTVSIQPVPAMRVAFMRHVGPYDRVGETWSKLFALAGPRGLLGPHIRIVGVVHDDPEVTPPERVRYDAGLIIHQDFKPAGEIGVQEIGGGEYAVAGHRGPYGGLGETYTKLCGQWLPAAGREPRSAPALEIYCNSPRDTPPEDLFTEIYIPLEQS
jgi:AraC family transcriptional regulator